MARLIDADALIKDWNELTKRMVRDADGKIPVDFGLVIRELSKTPTVDAVVMPKGKPGDYLEWDNGTGIKQIYRIYAVSFCEDYVRYDLEKFSPVVDHPNIVRIMSLDEAEKEWREMCAKAVPVSDRNITIANHQPIGSMGFVYACPRCRNIGTDLCEKCKMEVEGGFYPKEE